MGESTKWLMGLITLISVGSRYSAGSVLYEISVEECPELIKLNKFQQSGLFTDIIIQSADGQEFEAHKAVLAAWSDKLRALILMAEYNKPCTCEKTVLKVPVNGELLNKTLDYGYSGKITTTNDTVQHLLETADQLGFDKLTEVLVENFLTPQVTDETFVTMVVTTTTRPRLPDVEQKFIDQVSSIDRYDEERAIRLAKKFDSKLFKKYLEQTTLEPNKVVNTIVEWLKEAPYDPKMDADDVADVVNNIPFEGMNCTSLKKLADELTLNTDDKFSKAAKDFLKQIIRLSTNGEGNCYSGCSDCDRKYKYETSLKYLPNEEWNSTIIQPNQIQGKEYQLGTFRAGANQFLVTLQLPDYNFKERIGVSGLMLQRLPTYGPKSRRTEAMEYDCEIKITEKGSEKDCPLRNRFRYKFDHQTDLYKWLTTMDTFKEHEVSIKMDEVFTKN